MADGEQGRMSRQELLAAIRQAAREGQVELDLSNKGISELPDEIGQLANLQTLYLMHNQLTTLPESIGQLVNLQTLDLGYNQLTSLPETVGQLANLQVLDLNDNELTSLPEAIDQMTGLVTLNFVRNRISSLPNCISQLPELQGLYFTGNPLGALPEWIGEITSLVKITMGSCELTWLPETIGQLANLEELYAHDNQLTSVPDSIGQLTRLRAFSLSQNRFTTVPEGIGQFANIRTLELALNQLTMVPEWIGQLANLETLELTDNQLTTLPSSLARLEKLDTLDLDDNPLNPALQSAYESGLDELRAYLRSVEDEAQREELYEAKLLLVGEGGVGKTTLLKALSGEEPRVGEPTTHGVEIDIESLQVAHPQKRGVEIQLNAWDFGGQEVYRVTHQFFFSRRSIYLLVWEPRLGVQQSQVEDWLKMVRLRVGDDARVIIVSTHCETGGRIARINKPAFLRDFGSLIVGFHEVDSLVDDPNTDEKVGLAELKEMIADAAQALPHMGMAFNTNWKAARDELLQMADEQPHISYQEFGAVCARYGLDDTDTKTLADLMHDLGYIVYYGDDERLKNDVVLQPQWLTKAIGFVLEDKTTAKMDGMLPDNRLKEVWQDHPFKDEPRYDTARYPFFLRLMEKYDVSYRLEAGDASLVAQHVPQEPPAQLPWLPGDKPKSGRRRIEMVCVTDEEPAGLVPWMIVRTHQYACERDGHALHWQEGMFLRNSRHGEALLELRGSQFHLYAEAAWPEFFMNVLKKTLQKLITDNWPGMEGRYYFAVPCKGKRNDAACDNPFDIDALRRFGEYGDETIRCQKCDTLGNIVELLYGFAEENPSQQLDRIESKIERGLQQNEELASQTANYVMAIMQAIASESKAGPRLFTVEPVDGKWQFVSKKYRLHLWCEADGCQHPVLEEGYGVYEFKATREWVQRVAPYATFVAGVLQTVLPVVAPGLNVFLGAGTVKKLGLRDKLDLMKEMTGKLPDNIDMADRSRLREGALSDAQRSGVLALHSVLREQDPNQERLGLRRLPTYTGDFLWLCQRHYEERQPKIPDQIG